MATKTRFFRFRAERPTEPATELAAPNGFCVSIAYGPHGGDKAPEAPEAPGEAERFGEGAGGPAGPDGAERCAVCRGGLGPEAAVARFRARGVEFVRLVCGPCGGLAGGWVPGGPN